MLANQLPDPGVPTPTEIEQRIHEIMDVSARENLSRYIDAVRVVDELQPGEIDAVRGLIKGMDRQRNIRHKSAIEKSNFRVFGIRPDIPGISWGDERFED